jgi:carbamoylphosphate synthase small subunit
MKTRRIDPEKDSRLKQFCPQGHDTYTAGRTISYGCKRCAYLKRYEWRNNHPEAFQRYRYKADLKMKYGLSVEQHQSMIKSQNGHCAMCGLVKKVLVIDHCHKTNKVRGLLCVGCNVAVGHYENHKEQIEKYLGVNSDAVTPV